MPHVVVLRAAVQRPLHLNRHVAYGIVFVGYVLHPLQQRLAVAVEDGSIRTCAVNASLPGVIVHMWTS